MPLADLLQWLASARKTGTLSVRDERYTKQIFIKEGRIVSSASDDPTEQLGHFLLSRGRITEEQLRKGMETQTLTRMLLGKILLTAGALKEDELMRLLVQKAEETIFGLFLWSDAHFEFCDHKLPREVFVPMSLDVQEVLMKGLTWLDELRHIQREFGSSGTVLAKTGEALPDGFAEDRSPAGMILRLIDAKRSIADICLAVHASEFTVSKVLYQFFRQGYLTVVKHVPKPSPGPASSKGSPPLEVLVAQGREHLLSGDPEAAVEALRLAVAASPRDPEIKKLYDKACAEFKEKAYRHDLRREKVPTLTRDLNELTGESLTPEEVFLISRINGSWDLKSIIDISPLGEVDALRIMKKLLDRKIIELR